MGGGFSISVACCAGNGKATPPRYRVQQGEAALSCRVSTYPLLTFPCLVTKIMLLFCASSANADVHSYSASYRDLLGTAETVIEMDANMHKIEAYIGEIGRRCNTRILERKEQNVNDLEEEVGSSGMVTVYWINLNIANHCSRASSKYPGVPTCRPSILSRRDISNT